MSNATPAAVRVLVVVDDDTAVLDALAAGARGFLTKNAGRAEIGQAVTAAAAGLAPLDASVRDEAAAYARRHGLAPDRP